MKAKRRQLRRQRRQRRQVVNLLILSGVALLVIGVFFFINNQPPPEIVTTPPRIHPAPVAGTTIGDPLASVTIELFEDFQCPFCKNFTDTVEPQVLTDLVYTGQALIVYRHFVLIGPESLAAANASMCASEQDRFWDYHDALFANQLGENVGSFSAERLDKIAENLDLDLTSFQSCVDETRYQDLIDADTTLGRSYGIVGTPSVVVNGFLLSDPTFQAIQIAVANAPSNE